MSEVRGGGGGGGGGGGVGVDPSNLHLRRRLTQIRKASRVLRDPGTTSSWRSPPISSARSALASANAAAASPAMNHYSHRCKTGNGNASISNNGLNGIEDGEINGTDKILQPYNQFPSTSHGTNNASNGKEKKVSPYNWRTQKSESERSAATMNSAKRERRGSGDDNDIDGSSPSSMQEESVDDSLSDARNVGNDSKSDTCVADRYASMIFKRKETNLTPSIRRTIKNKSKKNTHSAAVLRHHQQQLQKQIVLGRGSKRALGGLPALGLSRDDLASLVGQSDDTEEYYASEDIRQISAASPLLARLRNKNRSHSSSKLWRTGRKEGSFYSSSTPALSTSSYNRDANRNPSTVGSWVATTASLNDGDDDMDDQLDFPGRQGCGIRCCWSRRTTPKYRGGCGSCYSPSLSDKLRRKGGGVLFGSQSMYPRQRRGSSSGSNKRRLISMTSQGVIPLLRNAVDGRGGSSLGTGHSDDELSTNFGELELEALSRLDGRRWSTSCRSQEGLELVALNVEGEEGSTSENIRSLSQKYRPMFFEELIGQNIVVKSLMNALSRGRIAPVYLFQGPRGTGKTSTARIFAAALNCLATEEAKPCGVCRECAEFVSGNSGDLREVVGSNKKGIDRVRHHLKNLAVGPPSTSSIYKVFIIDECHLLPSKTWLAFLKFLEEPPPRVVFIFITTDLDNVPRTVLSRCQKYLFNKIKDGDMVTRLRKIAADENLDVDFDALELIALNADGSLQDAETMLDQLSLLGKRITTSLVNELVGVVSDEKLLELLELAMSSNTAGTVKRARELVDSGVDPIVLMSQMATLIMDIIAGTFQIVDAKYSDSLFLGRSLTEGELERLKHALKLLSDAEKQLRVSSERSTWFTATLLQLGSISSPDPTQSGSSRRQSSKTTEEDPLSIFREIISQKQRSDTHHATRKSVSPASLTKAALRNLKTQENLRDNQLIDVDALVVPHDKSMVGNKLSRSLNSMNLDDIWVQCIDKCHSNTLRQLLRTYGKLVTISENQGGFIAYIAFGDGEIRTRAERFLSSITNSFEIILRCNVEVRIILLPDCENSIDCGKPIALSNCPDQKQVDLKDATKGSTLHFVGAVNCNSDLESNQEPRVPSRGSFNDAEGKLAGNIESSSVDARMSSMKERKAQMPVQRIESIIHEQQLETAWLQAAEKGTPGSLSRLKLERNQVLPQDGIYNHHQLESTNSMDLSSQNWEEELNHEINDGKAFQKEQLGKRTEHYAISPSVLHDGSLAGNFSKESMGYESGPGGGGCSGLFCWNNSKHQRTPNVKQGTPVRSHKGGRFLWFGECANSRRSDNRVRR